MNDNESIIEEREVQYILNEKNPNFREGRPNKFGKEQINLAMRLLESHTYKEVESMTGISKSTLIRAKRKLDIATDKSTDNTGNNVTTIIWTKEH